MNVLSIRAFIPPLARRIRHTPLRISRTYAVQAPGVPTVEIFSHEQKWMQKERAASDVETSRSTDYLRDEVANRLCERLMDINRHFPTVLDLGANACNIAQALTHPSPDFLEKGPRSQRVGKLICAESSEKLLYRDVDQPFNSQVQIERQVLPTYQAEHLPYPANTFDAVLSSLSMHWINDLPSILSQINNVLKPDSPFIGVMFGGDTLYELRTSLQLAEMERRGGISTHTSPLADVRDIGGLLQKAGFNLLTVDIDDIIVEYPSTFALMKDLQSMGESNAVVAREKGPIQRDVLLAAEAIYRELHKEDESAEGAMGDWETTPIPATFRLIFMIGWKKGEGQAKPLERGTGMFSIKDYLEKNGVQGDGEKK